MNVTTKLDIWDKMLTILFSLNCITLLRKTYAETRKISTIKLNIKFKNRNQFVSINLPLTCRARIYKNFYDKFWSLKIIKLITVHVYK